VIKRLEVVPEDVAARFLLKPMFKGGSAELCSHLCRGWMGPWGSGRAAPRRTELPPAFLRRSATG
jgi:hypothetical protein